DAQRKPRLPRPAGTRQGHEAGSSKETLPLGDLALTTDEGRRLRREERRRMIQAPDRRKVRGSAADQEMEEPLGIRQVLQQELAEVAKRKTVAEIGSRKRGGRLGDQHLAAVARRG